MFAGLQKKKCAPEGAHEKVFSFFGHKCPVAVQSLPEGMRKRRNTFYRGIVPLRAEIYDCTASLL